VEDLYRKALQLQPNYFTAHFNLGLYYKKSGRTEEAIRQFQEALRANPRSGTARQNLEELESNHRGAEPQRQHKENK
jgi:tetratricopeptide (TPR) repeat protein